MRRLATFAFLLLAMTGLASAADGWGRYVNPRYGYAIGVPPGFSPVREADNGDGGVSRSKQGGAVLMVWGASLLVQSFAADVDDRIESLSADGWDITYRSIKGKAASWSATRDERIIYARGQKGCEGEAAYFQVEYDAALKEDFDPVIKKLVKSFVPRQDCF